MNNFLIKTANKVPIIKITSNYNVELFIKREDLIHPQISGNKFWKLFYNIENYLTQNPRNPQIITFGGAFSNHIAATAAAGKEFNINTLGIIRGNELANNWQENSTLKIANQNGMKFRFINRSEYRDKQKLSEILKNEFPDSLIIPEGGTNELGVNGVNFMLNDETKQFDYLCCPVGTGGTVAGISKFAENNQKVLGFVVVKDSSLENKILELSGRNNFELINTENNVYGKITDQNIRFINDFHTKFNIQLEPIYTSKMLEKIFTLIEEGFFPNNSKILAFHTGGLQGIIGANDKLKKQGRVLIKFP